MHNYPLGRDSNTRLLCGECRVKGHLQVYNDNRLVVGVPLKVTMVRSYQFYPNFSVQSKLHPSADRMEYHLLLSLGIRNPQRWQIKDELSDYNTNIL